MSDSRPIETRCVAATVRVAALVLATFAVCAACGAPAPPPAAPIEGPHAPAGAGAAAVDPIEATNAPVPGLALVTLPNLERPALRHPVVPLDRDTHVRAPDDLTVPTVAVVDAAAAGLVDGSTTPPTLRLTQAPCRFVEAEPDASWDAQVATDCRAFHQEQFDGRSHRALRLAPGSWQIAVTNASVGRDVGLWLRSEDPSVAPLVSSGGVAPGETLTWAVELSPGRYLYSCPLNPTANYLIEVE